MNGKKTCQESSSRKYHWTDTPDNDNVTGNKTAGNNTIVNFAAVASEREKRVVEELDKNLARQKDEASVKKLIEDIKRREKAKKASNWICMCRPY